MTGAESHELCTLEAQLDFLKIACRIVEKAEDDEQTGALDGCLLYKLREGKPRGTMTHPAGEASETDLWCYSCKKYSTPVKVRRSIEVLRPIPLVSDYYYVFSRMNESPPFAGQHLREWLRRCITWLNQQLVIRIILSAKCEHCYGELWTIKKLCELLKSNAADWLSTCVLAVNALAMTYKYNRAYKYDKTKKKETKKVVQLLLQVLNDRRADEPETQINTWPRFHYQRGGSSRTRLGGDSS